MSIKPVAVKKDLSIDDYPPVLREPTEKRFEIAFVLGKDIWRFN